MVFNLISINFSFTLVWEFLKFYNWNFMFCENSSIYYSEAATCSPFYPHDIADIKDFYQWPFIFSHVLHLLYTLKVILKRIFHPFNPCKKVFCYFFNYPTTLYQLFNISENGEPYNYHNGINTFNDSCFCRYFLRNKVFWAF